LIIVVSPSEVIKPEITTYIAINNPRFWRMVAMIYCSMFLANFISFNYKTLAIGISDQVLTFAGSMGAIMSGVFRLYWGSIQDKYGFAKVQMILQVIEMIAGLGVVMFRSDPLLYSLSVVLAFMVYGGLCTSFTAAPSNIFGIAHGGFICSLLWLASPVSQLCSSSLYKFGGGSDKDFGEEVVMIGVLFVVLNLFNVLFFDDSEMEVTEEGKEIKTHNNLFNKLFRRDKLLGRGDLVKFHGSAR
jgi:hypothetical protein